MEVIRRPAVWVGALLFLLTAAVYLITLTPTVPFWDAGEFIAVSYILGIPHPPGTPFYVLLGRIATLVPWASVAERVNALSAIPAAIAVLLTYLVALRLIRMAQGKERTGRDEAIALAGAFTAGALLAFSDAFWENAIEAEVYALMSMAQILVFWLGLRWWEAHDRRPTAGPLLVAVYVMWLCVGLHLGVGIMGLPLMALVWMVDRRVAVVFAMPFLSVLLVTMGLERMAGGVLVLSGIVFLIFARQGKLKAWVAWVAAGVAAFLAFTVAFGDRDFTPGTGLLALAALLVPLLLFALRAREGRILALALLLMVVGYSTHLYLPIRAAQHPAINEGDPSSWGRLRDLLERKQYGQTSMFVRRAPWSAQLDKEFWRYFRRQWPLLPNDRWGSLIPLVLGIAGALWHARRERTSFVSQGAFVGLTTAGMILFLNFTDHEVRERDYFFQSGYHAYSIWIGLGAAWLMRFVMDSFKFEGARNLALAGTAALMAAQPFLLLRNLWYTHDRRGNYVARDYAYNMLVPLADSAYVFTNGDNDTFPLWYIQQVEGFRKDVRVVNLSLLNTDWYIFQLRDEEPRVPIALRDEDIRSLGQGAVYDERGNVIYTSAFMVNHIMQQNRKPEGGWRKPPYFAVTVPDRHGFDKLMTLEGLVQRVNLDSLGPEIDVPATERNLYEVFRYRGLFFQDGAWDTTVYKDENAATLSRNYGAAHLQLAFEYQKRGQIRKAIQEMERIERMFPTALDILVPLGRFYMEAGDTAQALGLFRRLVERNPMDSEAHYYHGVTLMFMGRNEGALQELDRAIELDRRNYYAYMAAYSMLMEAGQQERAAAYLERWSRENPGDPQVRDLLEGHRRGTQPLAPPPGTTPGGP